MEKYGKESVFLGGYGRIKEMGGNGLGSIAS